MAWCCQETSHYLSQCWPRSMTPYGVNKPHELEVVRRFIKASINSLWPSDAIWRQESRSTLVQELACCLTAPRHYLNQCWLFITKVQRCSSEGRGQFRLKYNYYFSKILFKSPRGQWVNACHQICLTVSGNTCTAEGDLLKLHQRKKSCKDTIIHEFKNLKMSLWDKNGHTIYQFDCIFITWLCGFWQQIPSIFP